MGKERQPRRNQRLSERDGGDPGKSELPPELAAFLREHTYACVTEATDHGTVLVVKAPASDIESLRGPVPILQRHELYQHPLAPVIRMVLTIFDRPQRPLKLETFINVADEQQRADFAALADQKEVLMLFYDEQLTNRLNKRIATEDPQTIRTMVATADQLRAAIPADRYDFDTAKAAVMRSTPL